MAILLPVLGLLAVLALYLWHCNRAISTSPPEAVKLAGKRWTKEEIQEAYKQAQNSPRDVRPYLLEKQNRRYVVTGGSGKSEYEVSTIASKRAQQMHIRVSSKQGINALLLQDSPAAGSFSTC